VELREFHDRVGVTTVFVTHDLEEAFYLADRVAVMNNGRLEQFASPEELYTRPATGFVADFVGYGNLVEGKLVAGADGCGVFEADGLTIRVDAAPPGPVAGRYAVPPHRIRVSPADGGRPAGDNVFPGVVHLGAYLGPTSNLLIDVAGHRFQCDVRESEYAAAQLERGTEVWVAWDAADGNVVEH
jgi:ABC-type Fe3+/spermidine/putrescine transport system ATPase subunit